LAVQLAYAGSGAITEPGAEVLVLLHDYAGIPEETLEKAIARAESAFHGIGVKTTWLNYPVQGVPPAEAARYRPRKGQVRLLVRLVPDSMVTPEAHSHGHLGYSLVPADGISAYICGVYAARAERLSVRYGSPASLVLGTVMAHELGHLLLGANSHSSTGIMSIPVTAETLKLAGQGWLGFSRTEAKRILRNLSRRLSDGATAATATAAASPNPSQ
jgi:hypothetical protein